MSHPKPPENVIVTPSYKLGALDLRFDDPKICNHPNWNVVGVNIYVSFDSPKGEYSKLNEFPHGSLVYRALTLGEEVEEDVTTQFIEKSTGPRGAYIFKTRKKPIIKRNSQFSTADRSDDIVVSIWNPDTSLYQEVPVYKVHGERGEVELIKTKYHDIRTNKLIDPLLPDLSGTANPTVQIKCKYVWGKTLFTYKFYNRYWFKVTTVALNKNNMLVETQLEDTSPATHLQMDSLDWFWGEAIQRNAFILDQGGETAKLFVRKWFGLKCHCWNEEEHQARNNCTTCFGTGYRGGYDGPVDVKIAPPSSPQQLDLQETGLRMNWEWETWTVEAPLLRTFDFLVRADGSRYSIGNITPDQVSGRILQQRFIVRFLDEADIRYKVPVDPRTNRWGPIPEEWDGKEKPAPSEESPIIVEAADGSKGRRISYENLQ